MVITDEVTQVDTTPSLPSPRRPRRRLLGIGTAIVVTVAVALLAVAGSSGATRSDQPPTTSPRLDHVVRDLVARGVVPAATLDDGTQITGPGFGPTPRTRDEIIRDLVARGVVPAATLDDGSQITSSTPEP